MSTRVVVTGMGMLTPLGNDVPTTWDALCQGKSGIGQNTENHPVSYKHLTLPTTPNE